MTDATTSAIPPADLDVVAVGNAIVDVIAHTDDAFLVRHELDKGSMRLIDTDQAGRLYEAMGPGTESSGGSAANTVAGVAALGGRAGFVGKVRDDQLGEVFAHDIKAIGVDFASPPATDGPPTARCLVLVTPDAQRTMNTYLGTAGLLTTDDIDPAFVASAQITYGEGYLWAEPGAKAALTEAFATARAAGRRTAFTLSDSFCVDANRAEFLDLLDGHVDIVFANEAEICSLFQVDSFDAALAQVRARSGTWALTRSSLGSVVVVEGVVHSVAAAHVEHVVDTTGAGDLYAAGFLFGLTHGLGFADCARLGGIAAAEIISHVGARPEVALTDLIPVDLRVLLA
jgi:sugar/nucleoside kinase (ribokinase family)